MPGLRFRAATVIAVSAAMATQTAITVGPCGVSRRVPRLPEGTLRREPGQSALVITDASRSYIADILHGYRQWTAERRLPSLVVEVQGPRAEVTTSLRSVLTREDPPDAIYTGSEDLALSVLNEAKSVGMSVPEDLGIASAVDSNILLHTSPQITGVFLHPRQIGGEAVRIIVSPHKLAPKRIDDPEIIPAHCCASSLTVLRVDPKHGHSKNLSLARVYGK
jgi:hypothetical protein